MIALIVGGAECAMAEFEQAKVLMNGHSYTVFAINDMIPIIPGEIIAITLHADKLSPWLEHRLNAGFPKPLQVWCNRTSRFVSNTTRDWGGSSGLFAAKIAKEKSMHSILCGVPMLVEANHFVRHQRWAACHAFRKPWLDHKLEMASFIRSFSGWTAEQYGVPSLDYINGK